MLTFDETDDVDEYFYHRSTVKRSKLINRLFFCRKAYFADMSLKIGSRRSLALEKRDIYGIDSKDAIQLKQIFKASLLIGQTYRHLKKSGKLTKKRKKKLRIMMAFAGKAVAETLYVPVNPNQRQKKEARMISVYDYERETFSEKFRFRSPEDLERLIDALKIPKKVSVHGYTFTSHEVVTISLLRLSYPLRWSDVQAYVPGRKPWQLRRAFYWFIDFMITNWGYLITNNRNYWLDELPKSAESIRVKLSTLANEGYRQFHPPLGEPNGFSVFGFIDNTLFAMSRPGGGPIGEGEQAPRFPKELQRAWYTGWKKLHGLKWQTVVMANGMDFEVWGPVSVRHPDSFTLRRSRNLHVTMYANQAAGYFLRMPPDLEHYLGQGPAARPIPADIIFSNDFLPQEQSDSSEDEEEIDEEHDD